MARCRRGLWSMMSLFVAVVIWMMPQGSQVAFASSRVNSRTTSVHTVVVHGLVASAGPYRLLQNGLGTGTWVLGRGQRLWELQTHGQGLKAIYKKTLPKGRLVAWRDGRMALITKRKILWIGTSGIMSGKATALPSGWHWVNGPGIQIRVGSRVEELRADHQWRTVARLPTPRGGNLLIVAVAQSPYQTGADLSTSPLLALWKRGRETVVGSFEKANGWRLHRYHLGPVAHLAVADTSMVIYRHPLTTITIAPMDDVVTETIYRDQSLGRLEEMSPVLTTRHGQKIAIWSPAFYPGRLTSLFMLSGTKVLGQSEEELLYQPTPRSMALAIYQPLSIPLYGAGSSMASAFKTQVVHREPRGGTGYLVARHWVDYQAGNGLLTVAKHRYRIEAKVVVADRQRLWLLTPKVIWEVGAGAPRRIPWPRGLGPQYGRHWLQEAYAVPSGTTLYAAVGKAISGYGSKGSQVSPLIKATLLVVHDGHATMLGQYPTPEGAVTSLALGPRSMLYMALYTGHHNLTYQFNMAGKGVIVDYNLRTHHWAPVAIPARFYRSVFDRSLRGQSIMSLVVLPGPRLYFLVQFNPNGQGGGFGGLIWEWHRPRMHYFDLPAYPMEFAVQLFRASEGGVLVNSGDTVAWIRPHVGLAYVPQAGISPTEWLGSKFLSESYGSGETTVRSVNPSPMDAEFLFKLNVSWPSSPPRR